MLINLKTQLIKEIYCYLVFVGHKPITCVGTRLSEPYLSNLH